MTARDGGTYTLCVELPTAATIEVGALGPATFEKGWYVYTGSALGSGGFSRIDRHKRLARGEREVRHWHIDYLLCHPESRLGTVRKVSGVDAECAVATAIDAVPVSGFGCTDCACETHLRYAPDREQLLEAVENAHRQCRVEK